MVSEGNDSDLNCVGGKRNSWLTPINPNLNLLSRMPLSDVIAGLRKRDRRIQQFFFENYRQRMFVVCLRYIHAAEDAEEVCMDGFVKAMTSIDSLQSTTEGGVYNWLKRIMVNTCINFLKRRKTIFTVAEIQGAEKGFEVDFLNRLSAEEIKEYIGKMPAGYRTVFNLSVIDGYSHGEIADMLGIKPKSVSSQLIKSTNHLQKVLTPIGIHYGNTKR